MNAKERLRQRRVGVGQEVKDATVGPAGQVMRQTYAMLVIGEAIVEQLDELRWQIGQIIEKGIGP